MSNVRVDILGMKQLEERFGKLELILDDKDIEDAFLAGARKFRDVARSKVKVKTGNLKKGIVAKKFKTKIKGQPAAFVAIDRKIAPHAHLVEYGHGGPNPAPPHPFFRPTLDEFANGTEIEQTVASAITKTIESTV